MSAKGGVPDAWDDDWVNAADAAAATPIPESQQPAKLSKGEKKRIHAEQQRQLWDTAENPGRNLWLEAQGVVPLKQEFKQPPTLLSRKPPTIAKKNVVEGVGSLNLEDEDSEEEARKKREADFEERQRKAKLEREEKQKRYAEARERIMGSSNPSTAPASRESSHSRDNRRTRGNKTNDNKRSQAGSPADNSPARQQQPGSEKQLFDPDDMGRRMLRRGPNSSPQGPQDAQPVRQPRGPEQSGRGGFGFVTRGGLSGV